MNIKNLFMKKIFLTLICALMCTVAALAQGNQVRGTVFDENGEQICESI